MARRTAIPDPQDLLTMREACERYKVGRSSIYRWADLGLIDLWKIGGSTRVDRRQIEARVIRRAVAS